MKFNRRKLKKSCVERCGIVLAGGEGRRLQAYVKAIRGDSLPKQFVKFFGEHSLLEHTFHRAETLISPERLFTIVNTDHLEFPEAARQLTDRPRGTVVLQPENKDTGPGILLSLTHLIKKYPDSLAAVFPSDHYITREALFMGYVEFAFRAVEKNPSHIVLLGMEPEGPETEYGYILPGMNGKTFLRPSIRNVLRFVEKPDLPSARTLLRAGGLWNTFVLVFKAKTLMRLIQKELPEHYEPFQKIMEHIGTEKEMKEVNHIYRDMEPFNFSREFLENVPFKNPFRLQVLPVRDVFWSDLGSPQRLINALGKTDIPGNPERIEKKSARFFNQDYKVIKLGP